MTVDGEDRFEIIAAFSKIFADQKVNIENLKALMPEEEKRALLVFEISLPMEIDRNALRRTLKDKARTLGLQLSMQHRDIFEALHRVQPGLSGIRGVSRRSRSILSPFRRFPSRRRLFPSVSKQTSRRKFPCLQIVKSSAP